jgi:hypothetical protein
LEEHTEEFLIISGFLTAYNIVEDIHPLRQKRAASALAARYLVAQEIGRGP